MHSRDATIWVACAWRACGSVGSVGSLVFVAAVAACGSSPEPVGKGCDVLVGDLVISEAMINPIGNDAGQEWIEIYNASAMSLTIDRLVVLFEGGASTQRHVLVGAGSLASKSYFVLGAGAADEMPFVDYSYGSDLAFNNEAGRISLLCKDTIIDSIGFGLDQPLAAPAEGVSLGFDGGIGPDAMLNDEAQWWCPAGDESYDGANRGTPGVGNPVCGIRLCQPLSGDVRETRPPGAADFQLTEVFANPEGAVDAGREWIEFFVGGSVPVDLNGLEILNTNEGGNMRRWQIQSRACLPVEQSDVVVVGFAPAEELFDAALSVDFVVVGEELYNSASTLELRQAGITIDTVSLGAPAEGKAAVVARNACHEAASGGARKTHAAAVGGLVISEVFADPDGTDRNREWLELFVASADAVDLNGLEIVNSLVEGAARSWRVAQRDCVAAAPGGFVVIGFAVTDEAIDAAIPADVVVYGSGLYNDASTIELWQGDVLIDIAVMPASISGVASALDRGTVADATKNDSASGFCAAKTKGSFGNGEETGTPGAANDLCGAGCFDGDSERLSVAPDPGTLVITEVFADPSYADADRDWFEIYVAAAHAVDLNGLRITNTSVASASERSWSLASTDCLVALSGQYVVVAGQAAVGDGVDAAALFVGGSSSLLFNAPAELALWYGDVQIDRVSYGQPIAGVATALDPSSLDATANDDAAHWCAATASSAGFIGGRGSPGRPNDACN